MKRYLVLALALALGGCVERTVQLYPSNDAARAIGPLTAHIDGNGMGSGTFSLALPSGEQMLGRYVIAMGGGVVVGSAYGSGGYASGSSVGVSGSGGGQANLLGDRGTTAECQFMNNNWVGHGAGSCRFSNGAEYGMQY